MAALLTFRSPRLRSCTGGKFRGALSGTLGLLLALLAAGFAQAQPRPNFLVILCDDLGYGDLSCFGHPVIETPHLDRLAEQGVRLTSCYSAAPVCSPSRVGLLTGRNPNRAGVYDWIPAAPPGSTRPDARQLTHLRRSERTVAGLLREAGYATAMAGKWHCNSQFNSDAQPQPGDAGFDHWFATQNNAAPSHENPVNYVRNGQPVGRLEGYSCQLAAAEAIGWLERQRQANPEQPFFLYVPFHEPHEPVASPPALVQKYLPQARDEDQAQYFANVENMDAAVGQLLAALERLGASDNTLVFFSSDNGPETLNRYRGAERSHGSPGPLRGMKLWTTEAGFRVPGIVRWPARVPAGRVSDQPVSSLDLLPTFCTLARAAVPDDLQLDGADLRPLLDGGSLSRPVPLFWVYYNALNEQRVALRDGPWKLLARLDGGQLPKLTNITTANAGQVRAARLTDLSLYHLGRDVGETEDLSQQEPQRLRQLTEQMERMYRELVSSMHVWPADASSKPAKPKRKANPPSGAGQ